MKLYLIVFLLFPFICPAQITESFLDEDMNNNPIWFGDITKFEIINPPYTGDGSINSTANNDTSVLRSLQSQSDAIIKLQSNYAYGEWRFSIADGKEWSVSQYNDYKIILISDDSTRANLVQGTHDFNGYYLKFDGANSDQFILYRQSGTTSTIILDTDFPAAVDGTTATARTVKIIRTPAGEWSIFIDDGFGINPSTQRGTTVTDNSVTTSEWFGIATNIDDPGLMRVLYFDDLYIGPVIADTLKPHLVNMEIASANQLDVYFNETVDSLSATNPMNYSIDHSIGNPDSAIVDQIQGNLVHIYLANPLVTGTFYTMTTVNVEDLSGNIMLNENFQFLYYFIQPDDIVINEIMADPTPAVYLPEFEYVELYNTSPYDLELKNWKLTIGATVKTIPDVVINSDDYLIICNTTAETSFQSYGNVLGISSFPSITNTGSTIVLSDGLDTIISSVTYSDTWYQDPLKTDGGWSLEKIDPMNQCGGYTNWKASENYLGGTPGTINSIDAANIDNSPPTADEVYVLNSQELSVKFSEPVSSSDISVSCFSVNNGIGNPVFFQQDANDSRIYSLSFINAFVIGQTNTLTLNNIKDDCGNILTLQEINFIYYEADPFDVVINEIMADPSPVIGLPENEYLELYNLTDYDINLTNWQLTIGTKNMVFPTASVRAKDYLIITSSAGVTDLQNYGEVLDMTGSTDLTNDGNTITLSDHYGKLIHAITYSSAWHDNSYKSEGGWSLEQKDYNNPCGGMENWTSSTDNKGGTPGEQNSVYSSNSDIEIPQLIRAIVTDTNSIKIFFNESLDTTTVFNSLKYSADNGLGNPVVINPVEFLYNSMILSFSTDFTEGIIYTLSVSDSIADCSGNITTSVQTCRFGIPDSCEPSDLVINEILFNPVGEGVDFVEIYNRSEKVLDLKDINIASRKEDITQPDSTLWELDPVNPIESEGFLVFPGDYYILSENYLAVTDQYNTENKNGFIDVSDLPSMNDDEGVIVLTDKWLNIIDEFHYSDAMHFSLLNDIEGISLERINFDNRTQDLFNWHSAAESVGFATPAYLNSQYSATTGSNVDVTITPEIFSPDNDGYNDILNISYKFEKAGFVGNVTIYDSRGRLTKKLIRNELLAIDGNIVWDGIDDYNLKAGIGIYILYFEIFDLSGNVQKIKKAFVLATKLND